MQQSYPSDAFLSWKADLAWNRFMRALRLKFDPDQPRDELGRWTDDERSEGSPLSVSTDFSAVRRGQSEAVCWSQYKIDLIRCASELRASTREICRSQAMERYSACLSGRQIPPLSY